MLYIIRHGKTLWNAQHRLQGRTDIPLSNEGILMAENAREECMAVDFDICYCSPLRRAVETAQIILRGRKIPIVTDVRLSEMSFGQYEGTMHYFTDPKHPLHELFQKPECYQQAVGGAESFQELFTRTGEFLEDIVYPLLMQERDILIVGHGAMNSAIISQVRGLPISEFWKTGIENCRLIRL